MKPPPRHLLEILREARALVAQPGNDFTTSGWPDAAAALKELDGLLEDTAARKHGTRSAVSLLFAPTGGLQELSAASGWANAFLALAERCDEALPELSPD